MSQRPLLSRAQKLQRKLKEILHKGEISLEGHGLDVAGVVAVAHYGCLPVVASEEVRTRLAKSAFVTQRRIDSGATVIYGVHTGFGGSADTRTDDASSLEAGLMQLLQSGILTGADLKPSRHSRSGLVSQAMPSSWTKAIIAVRLNQCVRGHSAIRMETIDLLLKLLAADVVPIVPLRGSISASGDLMPLAYVAGMLEGSPDIYVTRGKGTPFETVSARDVLSALGLKPLLLGPRQGLGLVNGTAASAAAASLAISEAIKLILLATGVTCLVSEGTAARVEWLHPFIARTRPHPGQTEVASIMRDLLRGSQLVSGLYEDRGGLRFARPDGGVAQDRYPLRTSPQWLGPQFEDLLSALSQISIELNSTTDNPLTDPATESIHHGGNFQAVSITSAAERIRSCMQMVGKLLSAQSTELLNHGMNAGLPPNLASDEPSVSFCCKGLDISIAAYQSELSYLANSMSNHIQSAEMHNQSVNSLAFLSARYTLQAVELLGMILSGVLFAACQAMDLRVMHATFLEAGTATLSSRYLRFAPDLTGDAEQVTELLAQPLAAFRNTWWAHSASDAAERCAVSAASFVTALSDPSSSVAGRFLNVTIREVRDLQHQLKEDLLGTYRTHRAAFVTAPTTAKYIGQGSAQLYRFVRKNLGIAMHRGLEDHPTPGSSAGKKTIGSQVSRIFETVNDSTIYEAFLTLFDRERQVDTPLDSD